MFLQKKRNCCCWLPRSFIRYGIYCRAYWLELVTYTQWLCLQQYLPTQNTLTKSLILISMRGNKSQTLWRNEVHYSNSSLNVSPFFLWKRNGEIFSTDYNCVLLCCGDLLWSLLAWKEVVYCVLFFCCIITEHHAALWPLPPSPMHSVV